MSVTTGLGAGAASAATTLGGYGDVDTSSAPTTTLLIDENGIQRDARKIDASTGQYVFDDDGRLIGMHSIAQMMQLAAHTVRGSAAVKDLGQTFGDIKVLGAGLQRQVENAVAVAFEPLVRQKLVRIDGVTVTKKDPPTTGAFIVVRWTDLTTGLEQQTTL